MVDLAPSPPRSGGLKPWHKRLIWFGVALAGMGGTYIAGRMQTSTKIDAAEAETATLQKTTEECQGDASAARTRAALLDARRLLHMMLLALDERNFGIAKEHLASAVALLKKHAGQDEGIAKLSTDLEQFPLKATEDLAAQRASLLKLVRRFDELVPAKP